MLGQNPTKRTKAVCGVKSPFFFVRGASRSSFGICEPRLRALPQYFAKILAHPFFEPVAASLVQFGDAKPRRHRKITAQLGLPAVNSAEIVRGEIIAGVHEEIILHALIREIVAQKMPTSNEPDEPGVFEPGSWHLDTNGPATLAGVSTTALAHELFFENEAEEHILDAFDEREQTLDKVEEDLHRCSDNSDEIRCTLHAIRPLNSPLRFFLQQPLIQPHFDQALIADIHPFGDPANDIQLRCGKTDRDRRNAAMDVCGAPHSGCGKIEIIGAVMGSPKITLLVCGFKVGKLF